MTDRFVPDAPICSTKRLRDEQLNAKFLSQPRLIQDAIRFPNAMAAESTQKHDLGHIRLRSLTAWCQHIDSCPLIDTGQQSRTAMIPRPNFRAVFIALSARAIVLYV